MKIEKNLKFVKQSYNIHVSVLKKKDNNILILTDFTVHKKSKKF